MLKSKKISLFTLMMIILMFIIVSECFAEKVVLKAGHANPPGEPASVAWEYISKRIDNLSEGQMKVEVYPASQLGNERDLVESVRMGTVDMTSPGVVVLDTMFREYGIYSLPYMFKSEEHLWKATDGQIGKQLDEKFREQTGIRVLAWWSTGTRHLFNTKRPIWEPQDLKGLKIRVPESDIFRSLFSSLGAMPTAIPYGDVYSSLATGVIDGAENDSSGYRNMKFYEVAKYLSLTGHLMFPKPVLINDECWDKLSQAEKDLLTKVVSEATEIQRSIFENNFNSDLEWLISQGVKINMVDKKKCIELSQTVWEKYKEEIGKDLIEEVANIK